MDVNEIERHMSTLLMRSFGTEASECHTSNKAHTEAGLLRSCAKEARISPMLCRCLHKLSAEPP